MREVRLTCYDFSEISQAFEGEAVQFEILPFKWQCLEKLHTHYGQEFDPLTAKAAMWRPPVSLDQKATIETTFLHRVNGRQDQFRDEHVENVCAYFNDRYPRLGMRAAWWDDTFSIIDFVGRLAALAAQSGWDDEAGSRAFAFSRAFLQIIETSENLRPSVPASAKRTGHGRGLAAAAVDDDPRVFKIDQVLSLSADNVPAGTYDVYLWQSWDPAQSVPPSHVWDYADGPGLPVLAFIPPMRDTKCPGTTPFLQSGMTAELGDWGWHRLHAVFVRTTTDLCADLRGVCDTYHRDRRRSGGLPASGYDLRTHLRLLKAIHLFLNRKKKVPGDLLTSTYDFYLQKPADDIRMDAAATVSTR